MIEGVSQDIPLENIAVHFHDTYKRALINILTSLDMGVSIVDSSAGSLGGCPYAQGATGNVSTEDVVYMLHELGIETGVDLEALSETANWICDTMDRPNLSLYNIL
jgi:hydroxymethylglutaryl-CoA lyase